MVQECDPKNRPTTTHPTEPTGEPPTTSGHRRQGRHAGNHHGGNVTAARLHTMPTSRRLILSPLLLAIALAGVIGVASSSAAAVPGPETRVRANATATVDAVGQRSGETAGGVGCLRPAQPDFVSAPCVATNTASSLGDDFTRALDDIDNGVSRPNVRDPKPFGNDGRGGTTRLPDADGAGNPISYTENTVNPRLPGGTLDGSRIVVGSDGSVWATTDHFTTWVQVR